MRSAALIHFTLMLLVVAHFGCTGTETPENKPGEFGDPCIPGANQDTPDGCVVGTECYKGYCEETCVDNTGCQPVEGWDHVCVAGLCQLLCSATGECPQSLGTALMCESLGSANLCKAEDDPS